MALIVEIVGLTGLLPAAVSFAIGCLVLRWVGTDSGSFVDDRRLKYAGGLAFAIAIFVSLFSLAWMPWLVESAWQWLPWLGLFAAVVFNAVFANASKPRGAQLFDECAASIAVAIVCAFAIVPDWPDMQPTRTVALSAVGFIISVATIGCRRLPTIVDPVPLCSAIIFNGCATCALMFLSGSMKFTQVALAMTTACSGAYYASYRRRSETAVQSLLPVFLTLQACLLYTGFNYSSVGIPDVAFILPAVAMITLNIASLRTIKNIPTKKRTALLLTGLLIPLFAAISIAVNHIS